MNAPSPTLSAHPLSAARYALPQITGALAISVGVLVLVGWLAGSQPLASISFEGNPITPNAALALIMSGASLLWLKASRQSLRGVAKACALALGLLALASLAEHATGWNLGIDELLFSDPYTQPPLAPGRIAPNTASGFLLTAMALWLMGRPDTMGYRRPWIIGGLGLIVMTTGITSIMGYVTGLQGFHGWWQLKTMPLPMALLLTLLGGTVLGITLVEAGVRWQLGRWLIGGFAVGLCVIIGTAVYARQTSEELAKASAEVSHALEFSPKIRLLAADLEIEHLSLQYGLLTDNTTLRDRTTQALATRRCVWLELRAMNETHADLQPQLNRTEQLINDYDTFIRSLISERRGGGSSPLTVLKLTAKATELSLQIRAQIDAIIVDQVEWLASRQAIVAHLNDRAVSILPIEIMLMTMLTFASIIRLNAEAAEHARSMDKLRRNEELNTSILNSMPAEIAMLNPAGVIMAVNEAWLRFARENGARAESSIGIGANYFEVCRHAIAAHTPYVDEVLTGIQAVINGTRPEFQHEYPCLNACYLLHVTPIHGNSGGALIAHLDITARKQAENALHKSEDMYRRLLHNLDAGIVVHAADTSILMNNVRASEILGLSPDQMRGKTAIDPAWHFIEEDNTPLELSRYPVSRVLAEKKTINNQLLGIQRSGETKPVWVLVNGFPERDSQGNITEILISFTDITARKEAEAKIRILNAELEQRVVERTAELKAANANIQKLNANLNTRAAKLEAINKELEAFSYSVSHDLRAPLRAIDGYALMAIEDFSARIDDDGRRLLKVICDEARRMSRLIDDLLSFSRISRQQTEPEMIDMHAMAQEVFNELIKAEPGRSVQFDLQTLPPTQGTPAMIRQVWVNLISNALKFTRKRPVASIEIGAQEGVDKEWVYHVKDNGAGFDMRFAKKLFGVFQRLHNQPDFEGTGVGLALVQRILQRHGGRIWAESELDQGARFYFTLPALKTVSEEAEK